MQIAGFDQFMWVSPAEMVVNYFFGSVRYLKSNAKKMCQYKMRDGVAIFSKKLVFSNEGQKEEIHKICPVLRNVFYGFIIFIISIFDICSILDFFFTERE